MTQEILKFNRRCAEFLKWTNLNDDSFPEYINHNGLFYPLKNLLFHSDYNWIMEVVESIEKLNYYTKNECIRNVNYFNIYELENNEVTFYGTGNSKKEAFVEAIDIFLKWYEQNK